MKPLILEYVETPPQQNLDFSLIEYSEEKNLSVLKGTQTPAIVAVNCDTVTHTRASIEGTDNDADKSISLKMLVDTQTQTFVKSESTSDQEPSLKNLKLLVDTQTLTESKEATDSDR